MVIICNVKDKQVQIIADAVPSVNERVYINNEVYKVDNVYYKHDKGLCKHIAHIDFK